MLCIQCDRKSIKSFAPKVTVNYRLPLHLAPTWFRDSWTRWHQDLKRQNMEEEKEIKDLGRKAFAVDEEEKQGTNDEFHSKELLEERFEEEEEEKER